MNIVTSHYDLEKILNMECKKYTITTSEKDGTSIHFIILNSDLDYAKNHAQTACRIYDQPCWQITDDEGNIVAEGVSK